jgi:hypothetical protein
MAQVGRQDRQPGFDVLPGLIPPQQGADGEGVAQVVVMPTSA